jgi:predicted nucleotidyltransferase
MVSQAILNSVRDRLVEGFHPVRIILFGSQARQQADTRSDLDLLVICPFSGSRRQLMLQMDHSLKGLGIARDILVMRPEEFERDKYIPGTIARPASKEGVILYERN